MSVSIFEYDEEKEMALIRKAEREAGMEVGMERGIRAFVTLCQKMGLSEEDTLLKLTEEFSISRATAEAYLKKYRENA